MELDLFVATAVIVNRSREPLAFRAEWCFEADYADLLEASEGDRRQQRAAVHEAVEPAGVVLRYAHERLRLVTRVRGEGATGCTPAPGGLRWEVALAPRQSATLRLVVEAEDPERRLSREERSRRQSFQDRWRASLAEVRTPRNSKLDEVLERSRLDLASMPLLEGEPDE